MRSGAYQAGASLTFAQGSCRYQSPSHRSFRGGLGISAWARPQLPRVQLSRNRCPTVAQVIGIRYYSRARKRDGTFRLSFAAFDAHSGPGRLRHPQAISKSAEMETAAGLLFLKGAISIPPKSFVAALFPCANCPFHSNTLRKRPGLYVLITGEILYGLRVASGRLLLFGLWVLTKRQSTAVSFSCRRDH